MHLRRITATVLIISGICVAIVIIIALGCLLLRRCDEMGCEMSAIANAMGTYCRRKSGQLPSSVEELAREGIVASAGNNMWVVNADDFGELPKLFPDGLVVNFEHFDGLWVSNSEHFQIVPRPFYGRLMQKAADEWSDRVRRFCSSKE